MYRYQLITWTLFETLLLMAYNSNCNQQDLDLKYMFPSFWLKSFTQNCRIVDSYILCTIMV